MLLPIMKAYPNAVFLLGHAGGDDRGRLEAEEAVMVSPNAYLEFCGSFSSHIPWRETVKRVGGERILYGSDATFHNPAWELGRIISSDIPIDDLELILSGNIRRILRQ